jgi:nucleotide-binding universal stress UspA family protein
MNELHEQRIERVCIALDAASSDSEALQTAASLAAELDAELAGFFMEDLNILRAAALSFTREMGLSSGMLRPMPVEETERALRAQAQRVRSSLAQIAGALQLRWSFKTVRAVGITEILELADEVSLTVMAPRSRFLDTRALSTGQTRRETRSAHRPVVVLYQGSDEEMSAVRLAALLARSRAAPLTVVLGAGEDSQAHMLQERVERTAVHDVPGLRYLPLAQPTLSRTAAAAREQAAGLLVVAMNAGASQQALSELLSRLECPLVVVRTHRSQ